MLPDGADREFHVSRRSREKYGFDEQLFSLTGNVIIPNLRAAREFAQKMNEARDLVRFPEQAVKPGQIHAMGLIDEALHLIIRSFREQKNAHVMAQALDWLNKQLGQAAVDRTLGAFAGEFPTVAAYRQQMTGADYLNGGTLNIPHREIALEELLMLWLANVNPAFTPHRELFDDSALKNETAYEALLFKLHEFFGTQPGFGPDGQNLVDLLRAPMRTHPHSLSRQLDFILSRWGYLLGGLVNRLLGGLDLLREEEHITFAGPGPALVPVYPAPGEERELERFSPDRDWMPELVLIAKNIYVWLAQLSTIYGRSIRHLDEIPDEELDRLAGWGLTGLWMIGLWERSPASQKIKQIMGNPEAVASAYSVYEYRIAQDLGGEPALQNLRERAAKRGIRLASDMVPNHMGIDSNWVTEHPDYFVSVDQSPFPSYTFNGPDLSSNPGVGLYVEDHYYDHSDAAVVFKRVDRSDGSVRYLYHGNDGTSMPWNDTAQLNYLEPQVRQAVIQAILNVARQFPVIRFDAAMTLAKKHYQRLWFPEPGTGGAIPSRAEHGLSRAEFDARMPEEFWREVVDRVAAEAPDTLLLAEAFWLMEGYFVRTLGMHRVYNSAFMNMLRDEENGKYRSVMKNTLEFDPEILRRYVNFMNNPDERTAVDQFGKGDKYFGICTLMATLPGLPMLGHGQVEGFAEKYGMEYTRAYWDEKPDRELLRRHENEIFPLLRLRPLFAGVESFLLYDFYSPAGQVNEDVYAYSNRFGNERALVVYHNKFAETRGWIRTSAAFSVKDTQGDERRLLQKSLGEGWGLHAEGEYFTLFRDQVTGLEYLRKSKDLHDQGMYIELKAYQRHIFVDVREVQETDTRLYAQLAARLDGRGVPSISDALRQVTLQPIHLPFKELVSPSVFGRLAGALAASAKEPLDAAALDDAEGKLLRLLQAVKEFTHGGGDPVAVAYETRLEWLAALALSLFRDRFQAPRLRNYRIATRFLDTVMGLPCAMETLLAWLTVHAMGKMVEHARESSVAWIDEWMLGQVTAEVFRELGASPEAAWRSVAIIRFMIEHEGWRQSQSIRLKQIEPLLAAWMRNDGDRRLLGVNRFGGVLWFNQEAFEELLGWMFVCAAVEMSAARDAQGPQVARELVLALEIISKLRQAETASGFRVQDLLTAARQMDATSARPRATRPGAPRRRAQVEPRLPEAD